MNPHYQITSVPKWGTRVRKGKPHRVRPLWPDGTENKVKWKFDKETGSVSLTFEMDLRIFTLTMQNQTDQYLWGALGQEIFNFR